MSSSLNKQSAPQPPSRFGVIKQLFAYMLAIASVGLTTAVISALKVGTFANASMLYLLVIMLIALFLGSIPAILASVIAFFTFDWFFVQPFHTLTVRDPTEWLALCMFLLVATIVGQLTALLKTRAEEARRRQLEATALAEASWSVVSELELDQALSKILAQLSWVAGVEVAILFKATGWGTYDVAAKFNATAPEEQSIISTDALKFVQAHAMRIGLDGSPHWDKALKLDEPGTAYLPVCIEQRVIGILYLRIDPQRTLTIDETRIIESLSNYAAVVIHRDNLMKLQAAAQVLAEADRLKTALLSMVSHDFRSPLTSIKASVGSLLHGGVPLNPETQRGLLQGIDEETDRLNRLVGNILDLSRLESGAWRPRCEMTPITELIGSALDCFGQSDNARIEVHLSESPSEIWVDSVQFVQVLKNLLENALKYSAETSSVLLEVKRDGANALIDVLDSGPGLPIGDEEQIFEPFYRAPAVKESSTPGMGVGLTICRGLVEAHGGTLIAYNRDTQGSVFRVTLPIASSNGSSEAERNESSSD